MRKFLAGTGYRCGERRIAEWLVTPKREASIKPPLQFSARSVRMGHGTDIELKSVY